MTPDATTIDTPESERPLAVVTGASSGIGLELARQFAAHDLDLIVQSLTQAVQDELKDTDVTITTLMPGPTETEFFERAGMAEDTRVGRSAKDDPAQVARQGFEALMNGDARVVGGGGWRPGSRRLRPSSRRTRPRLLCTAPWPSPTPATDAGGRRPHIPCSTDDLVRVGRGW